MTLIISSAFNGVSDPDAAAYIQVVEAADGELLEFAVGKAINDFVLGCKADGIWDAIKASCIMAGARTLNGALVPLVGAAPTNFNFVAGDYDRKTGLVGNGSTKYLDSNRNNTVDPQNNKHVAVWASSGGQNNSSYYGAGVQTDGATVHFVQTSLSYFLVNHNSYLPITGGINITGLIGASRSNPTQILIKDGTAASVTTRSQSSLSPFSENIFLFRRGSAAPSYANARLAFYSIGEALDLALLDARVTTLINAFAAAIP